MSDLKKETVEEFFARGGSIKVLPSAGEDEMLIRNAIGHDASFLRTCRLTLKATGSLSVRQKAALKRSSPNFSPKKF